MSKNMRSVAAFSFALILALYVLPTSAQTVVTGGGETSVSYVATGAQFNVPVSVPSLRTDGVLGGATSTWSTIAFLSTGIRCDAPINAPAVLVNGVAVGGATFQSVSTTATLGATSAETVLVASVATYTITLPTVSAAGAGRRFLLCCDSTIVNTTRVTLDADGAETIDGGASILLSTPYTQVEVTCDGSTWRITRWVAGAQSAFVPTNVTMTTNTTTTAYMEQPSPRQISCHVVQSFAGTPDTATLTWDAAPPGFTIDETDNPWLAGNALFSDATSGTLGGLAIYIQATNSIKPFVTDDAAAATFYLLGVTEGTDAPVSIANNDAVVTGYTLRVQ